MVVLSVWCAVAPNLHYLGRSGVKEVSGLSIAYLSGVYEAASYHESATPARGLRYENAYLESDVSALIAAVAQREATTKTAGVDILLTAEWPRQYHHLLSDNELPAVRFIPPDFPPDFPPPTPHPILIAHILFRCQILV